MFGIAGCHQVAEEIANFRLIESVQKTGRHGRGCGVGNAANVSSLKFEPFVRCEGIDRDDDSIFAVFNDVSENDLAVVERHHAEFVGIGDRFGRLRDGDDQLFDLEAVWYGGETGADVAALGTDGVTGGAHGGGKGPLTAGKVAAA